MTKLLLGLDIGTSFIKAVLINRGGQEVAVAASPTPTFSPVPGWSEVHPDVLWAATCRVIAKVLQTEGVASEDVAAVGISGAMVGAWVVDKAGNALRPGILWNDSRTQSMIDNLVTGNPQFMSQIFEVSGSVMQQGCTLPLLQWLSINEPAIVRSAHAAFGVKDYIRFQLTNTLATDRTEAAVAPGSAFARGRSQALISLFCGVLTSIELFLNLNKKMEVELTTYKSFYTLVIDIYHFIETTNFNTAEPNKQKNIDDRSNEIYNRYKD